jgi:succinate dehydrogenase hydrophobic anchor subunit
VELISDLLGFLLPVALLGPIGALAARQVRIALAAAFGPALVCLFVVGVSFHTSWGGQRVTEDGDMSNAASLLLSLALFLVVGAIGLALGRGLQVASQQRQS